MALVVRAGTIVTNATSVAQNGVTFDALGLISDGAIVVHGGRILWSGRTDDLPLVYRAGDLHEYPDCVAFPGFVDAHAHPFFAGNREPDFAARLRGQPAPLGMLHTVEATRKALEHPEDFWTKTLEPRLRRIAEHGTTTLETKTGYALHKPGEMELLDLIHAHREQANVPRLIATFLGAHALPPEFTDEHAYIDYLIDQCIPFAKAHGAVYADVFCEPGFFSPPEARRYLEASRAAGLRLRAHCDEMAYGQAAQTATQLDVDAVDHCNYIRETDTQVIAEKGIVLVACPTTIAYLDLARHAPVRELLALGGFVALASDYNPGTSPCFNLQTVAFHGRKIFKLTAAEALYGVTVAAARSLAVQAGTLSPGASADLAVLRMESPEEFGWQFGGNLAAAVYRAGTLIA
ncbi:MAG TPA: amidohydrolase family protein [Candidatus Baltobacteraceae bacterium]|nr:amidohydrolase family protein [Candidatus Baltobacteraceae bacterium]